jgi:hypothetical protein
VIPNDPQALLTRVQTAAALTQAGFPVSPATLSTKATRGGGPPYRKFGPRALYEWGTSLRWATERLRDPVRNTSENDASQAKLRPPSCGAAQAPRPRRTSRCRHGDRTAAEEQLACP